MRPRSFGMSCAYSIAKYNMSMGAYLEEKNRSWQFYEKNKSAPEYHDIIKNCNFPWFAVEI